MKALRERARFFALLCLFQIPIGFLFTDYWFIDATTHFVPQQILLFLTCMTIWLLPAKKKIAIPLLTSVLALVFLSPLLPGLAAEFRILPIARNQKADLQLITFNVLTSNSRKSDVRDWLLASLWKDEPNLVVLLETDEKWVEELAQLERVLPYKYLNPRSDNFGIAVFSSVPIDGAEFSTLEETCEVPEFTGRVKIGDKSLEVIGVHTLPPGPGNIAIRNSCLKAIEELALAHGSPTVVTGDLNCAPLASCFPRKLHDAFPLLFRKHTWSVLGGVVSTALDHLLHTKGVFVMEATVGPDLGSDHRPIKAKIKFN